MFATLALITFAHAAELSFQQGTFQLGGSGTIDLYFGRGSEVALTLAPEGGYFVADRIEVVGGLTLVVVDEASAFSLQVGGRYFLETETAPVYLGAGLGFGEVGVATLFGDETAWLTLEGGVLLPLSDVVAVDLGAKMNVFFEYDAVHLPMGYLGVQAFIPKGS